MLSSSFLGSGPATAVRAAKPCGGRSCTCITTPKRRTGYQSGTFSLSHATWRFVVDVIGGIAIGLAVGFVLRQVRRRLNHSPTEIAIALFSGYFAYLPAQAAGHPVDAHRLILRIILTPESSFGSGRTGIWTSLMHASGP